MPCIGVTECKKPKNTQSKFYEFKYIVYIYIHIHRERDAYAPTLAHISYTDCLGSRIQEYATARIQSNRNDTSPTVTQY